jgi:hypothetical protein
MRGMVVWDRQFFACLNVTERSHGNAREGTLLPLISLDNAEVGITRVVLIFMSIIIDERMYYHKRPLLSGDKVINISLRLYR